MKPSLADRPGAVGSCPATEPASGTRCALAVGSVCPYRIAAVRQVFCRCYGPAWGCGTPLGIDSPSDAPGCPASAPAAGSTCTLQVADPPGMRLGCHYEVAATPIIHDCACAHPASSWARASWDCAPRVGDGPIDARGCPARQPMANSLCVAPVEAQCQYGYNLSTTCRCAPIGTQRDRRAWQCERHSEPLSPSRPR